MFKSISWQEYLFALSIIAAGYYILIVGLFYSRDIIVKLKGVPQGKEKIPQPIEKPSKNFMGPIHADVPRKLPVKESTAIAEEISIESQSQETPELIRSESPAADLLEKIEELLMIMEGGPVQKSNYIKSIKTLINQYPQFKGTQNQKEVSRFVCDQFKDNDKISFSIEEIEVLWLNEKEEIINQTITINNYEK